MDVDLRRSDSNCLASQTTNELSSNAWEWLSNLTLTAKGLFLSSILEKPKIFVSCLKSAGIEALLRQHQITHIFSFAPQPEEQFYFPNKALSVLENHQTISPGSVYQKLGISRYLFQLKDDNTNPDFQLQSAFEAFEDLCRAFPEGRILIHCELGASRSISFVAALIAKSENCSFKSAVLEIRKHREVGIDAGLAMQLSKIVGIPCE